MTYEPNAAHIYVTAPEAMRFLGMTPERWAAARRMPDSKRSDGGPHRPKCSAQVRRPSGSGGEALYRLNDLIAFKEAVLRHVYA